MQQEVKINPWFAVPDAAAAVSFYRQAFSAVETYRLEGEDGSLVARLSVAGAEFWVADSQTAKAPLGGENLRMILIVNQPDDLFSQALQAGATEISAIQEEYGWRLGRMVDPFGLHWEIGHELSETGHE